MARIAVTGASGNVGQEVIEAFDDTEHELTLITRTEQDDMDSIPVDVTNRDAFVDALSDEDVLIHLAANPSPYAEWDDLHEVNIQGTYNAYIAAIENGLDRVVYASSNHAINGKETVDPDEPETMHEDAPALQHDAPPHPDSWYGVTKVASESIGNRFAYQHDIETVNLRIGWLMSRDQLRDSQENPETDYPEANARFARAMWLSKPDCHRALRAAALSELRENPVAVHAISRNDDRCLSLTHTLRSIDYKPRDDSAEVLDGE